MFAPHRLSKVLARQHETTPLLFYKSFKIPFLIYTLFGYMYLPYPLLAIKPVRIIITIYSLIVSIGTSGFVLFNIQFTQFAPYVFVMIEYVYSIIFLVCTKMEFRETVFRSLEWINDRLNFRESYNHFVKMRNILIVLIFFGAVFRVSFFVFLNFILDDGEWWRVAEDLPIIICSCFVLIASDIQQIPRVLVFIAVKSRVKTLKSAVEGLYSEKGKLFSPQERIKYLAYYREIYRDILDILENLAKFMNPLYLVTLSFTFPKVIWLLYYIIGFYSNGLPMGYCFVIGLEGIEWLVLPCLPGIVVEMTKHQVQQMCLFLTHQTRECKDDKEREEIKDFITYLLARPYNYVILRVFPIDGKLPIIILGVCAKYFIVVAKITNLIHIKI